MPNTDLIRKSRARTAWGLLEDVIEAIREEPKRLNMKRYLASAEELGLNARTEAPACGTIACIAGWTVGLHNPQKLNTLFAKSASMDRDSEVPTIAEDLLGEANYTIVSFQNKTRLGHLFASDGDDIQGLLPGTPEYAEGVVSRIRKFMELNKAALKAKRV